MTETLSNGFPYTNSYGDYNIPYLFDNQINRVSGNIHRETTRRYCDSCGNQYRDVPLDKDMILFEHTYPCVMKADDFSTHTLSGINALGVLVRDITEAICEAEFLLCVKCGERADAIMEISDHIASGESWWMFCRNLSDQIYNEELWEKWAGGDDILIRNGEKTRSMLLSATTGPFADLPSDVLDVMFPHIVEGEKWKCAIKIQALYRGWLVRNRDTNTHRWDSTVSFKEAQHCNLWTVCDDCGVKRSTKDLIMCPNSNGIQKVICKKACCYICPMCKDTNLVKIEDKRGIGPIFFDCLCGENFLLTL